MFDFNPILSNTQQHQQTMVAAYNINIVLINIVQ